MTKELGHNTPSEEEPLEGEFHPRRGACSKMFIGANRFDRLTAFIACARPKELQYRSGTLPDGKTQAIQIQYF